MLFSFAAMQAVPMDAICRFEKGCSYIYDAASGTEIRSGGHYSQTRVSIGAGLLFGSGDYEFLSGVGS
jgi:hypothetical protein